MPGVACVYLGRCRSALAVRWRTALVVMQRLCHFVAFFVYPTICQQDLVVPLTLPSTVGGLAIQLLRLVGALPGLQACTRLHTHCLHANHLMTPLPPRPPAAADFGMDSRELPRPPGGQHNERSRPIHPVRPLHPRPVRDGVRHPGPGRALPGAARCRGERSSACPVPQHRRRVPAAPCARLRHPARLAHFLARKVGRHCQRGLGCESRVRATGARSLLLDLGGMALASLGCLLACEGFKLFWTSSGLASLWES